MWLDVYDKPVGLPVSGCFNREGLMWHWFKLYGNNRYGFVHPFTGAQIKRDSLPAPVIQKKFYCRKSFNVRIFMDIRFIAIGFYLFPFYPALAVLPPYGK